MTTYNIHRDINVFKIDNVNKIRKGDLWKPLKINLDGFDYSVFMAILNFVTKANLMNDYCSTVTFYISSFVKFICLLSES